MCQKLGNSLSLLQGNGNILIYTEPIALRLDVRAGCRHYPSHVLQQELLIIQRDASLTAGSLFSSFSQFVPSEHGCGGSLIRYAIMLSVSLTIRRWGGEKIQVLAIAYFLTYILCSAHLLLSMNSITLHLNPTFPTRVFNERRSPIVESSLPQNS